EPRPAEARLRRTVPRGPVLQVERDPGPPAASPRTGGRRPAARRGLPRGRRGAIAGPGEAARSRRARRARRVRVARKRARAGERSPARLRLVRTEDPAGGPVAGSSPGRSKNAAILESEASMIYLLGS